MLILRSAIACGGNDTSQARELFSEDKVIPADVKRWVW